MARVTKAEQIENLRNEVERLSDELIDARVAHQDEVDDLVSRAITRNGEYEAEIRNYRDSLDDIVEKAQAVVTQAQLSIDNARSRAQFLAQGLVAISAYSGNDIDVILALADALIADWVDED